MSVKRFSHNLFFAVIPFLILLAQTCLAENPSKEPDVKKLWTDNLFGGAILEQGFHGPLESNLNSAVLLQLRYDNSRLFIPLNIGPSFYYLNDKTLDALGLSKSHQYLGQGLQLETGFSVYFCSSRIAPYAGIGVFAAIGETIDPGQIARFESTVEGGILNDSTSIHSEMTNGKRFAIISPYLVLGVGFFRRHPFFRMFMEVRYRYYFTNRENGYGPQFAVGFVFRRRETR